MKVAMEVGLDRSSTVEHVRAASRLVDDLRQACPLNNIKVRRLIYIPGQHDVSHREIVADLRIARLDELQQVFWTVDRPRWVVQSTMNVRSDTHIQTISMALLLTAVLDGVHRADCNVAATYTATLPPPFYENALIDDENVF